LSRGKPKNGDDRNGGAGEHDTNAHWLLPWN